MASGLLMLISSFLPFYKIGGDESGIGDLSWSGWSTAVNIFPIATVAILLVVALAGQVALARFANVKSLDGLFGFSWRDLRLLVGGIVLLVMFCYLIRSFGVFSPGFGKGIGLWIAFLSSIGFMVGAVMERNEAGGGAVVEGRAAKHPAPTPSDLAIMASGVIILIGSFLALYTEGDESLKAWDSPLFPLYVLPALFGVLMAAQVAVTTFTSMGLPERILGLDWKKIHLALGIWAAFMMLAFLIGHIAFTADDVSNDDPSKGIGYWLMLISALGLAGGAIMRLQESGTPATPAPPPAAAPPPPPPPPR